MVVYTEINFYVNMFALQQSVDEHTTDRKKQFDNCLKYFYKHYESTADCCNAGCLHMFTQKYNNSAWPSLRSLPDHLRDPAGDSEQFRRDLKTYLFAGHS